MEKLMIDNGVNFFITTSSYNVDIDIAEYLGLSFKEYQNILINNNAYRAINGECYFQNRIDAENTIKKLEPYLIMSILTNS